MTLTSRPVSQAPWPLIHDTAAWCPFAAQACTHLRAPVLTPPFAENTLAPELQMAAQVSPQASVLGPLHGCPRPSLLSLGHSSPKFFLMWLYLQYVLTCTPPRSPSISVMSVPPSLDPMLCTYLLDGGTGWTYRALQSSSLNLRVE